MTFTYNLASADAEILRISKVRLELGDTVANTGVRPDGTNLQDEEIKVWLGEESNDIQAAAARAARALASMWTTVANITVGPRSEQLGQIADGWAKRADELAPLDLTAYAGKFVAVDHKHDPYQVRPEDEMGR